MSVGLCLLGAVSGAAALQLAAVVWPGYDDGVQSVARTVRALPVSVTVKGVVGRQLALPQHQAA